MTSATGYYLNVYDDDIDVFIIFNEANDEPTSVDYIAMQAIIEDEVKKYKDSGNSIKSLKKRLRDAIDKVDFNCTACGYQIII